MSLATVENLSLSPGTSHTCERKEAPLAGAIDELIRLRFSILLTARWAEGETEDPERCRDLRVELVELRKLYFDGIDEIAMKFSVQQAIDAEEEVERDVVLPRDTQTVPERADE